MLPIKKEHPKEKSKLHTRSKHRFRYDFKALTKSCAELAPFVSPNRFNDESIDFFNPDAVKMLNKAILKVHYNIEYWDIPKGFLCPPIPGRADYIHHIADVLAESNHGKIPTGQSIKVLDIGVGANCVYPIIGTQEYGWFFVGSDIDSISVESANKIRTSNFSIKDKIEIRFQSNSNYIFEGIIQKGEQFDLTICNPPFHASANEANAGSRRKLKNLKANTTKQPILNFAGQKNELWCEGGEARFVENMVLESMKFAISVFWFSTLISKQSNLVSLYKLLEKNKAVSIKTIEMGQGNKISRIVAWTFLTSKQQKDWKQLKR